MANEQNLIPLNQRPKSEQRAIQQMGVEASIKARQNKKTFQQLTETLLSLDVTSAKSRKVMSQMGISDEDMQYKTLCILGLLKAAQNGNVNAFEKLQELTGETGTQKNNGILEELTEYLKQK